MKIKKLYAGENDLEEYICLYILVECIHERGSLPDCVCYDLNGEMIWHHSYESAYRLDKLHGQKPFILIPCPYSGKRNRSLYLV